MFDLNEIKKGSAFFYIDDQGRDHVINLEQAIVKICEKEFTVKVEGMEHLVEEHSNSVHCFIAPKGAKSFPNHTDLVDLKILCVEGTKGFEVEGKRYDLKEGDYVFVDEGVYHRAINDEASVMLSIEL